MPKARFKGMLAFPQGTPRTLEPRQLEIRQADARELFEKFAAAIKGGAGFTMTLSVEGDERPITVRFHHMGRTAAFALLSHDVDGQPKHIHSLLALLSRLEPDDDRKTIEHCRKFKALSAVRAEAFDAALSAGEPVSAMFFADSGSANHPPLYNVAKILSAAFFDQHNIGNDQNSGRSAAAAE